MVFLCDLKIANHITHAELCSLKGMCYDENRLFQPYHKQNWWRGVGYIEYD